MILVLSCKSDQHSLRMQKELQILLANSGRGRQMNLLLEHCEYVLLNCERLMWKRNLEQRFLKPSILQGVRHWGSIFSLAGTLSMVEYGGYRYFHQCWLKALWVYFVWILGFISMCPQEQIPGAVGCNSARVLLCLWCTTHLVGSDFSLCWGLLMYTYKYSHTYRPWKMVFFKNEDYGLPKVYYLSVCWLVFGTLQTICGK